MIEAARAAARSKGTYSSAQYARIARRRGPNKAAVAVANSMLNVVWHLLLNAGEQQVLSTPDVVESLGAIYLATNSCHGILNNHECSRQLLNTIPALTCADADS